MEGVGTAEAQQKTRERENVGMIQRGHKRSTDTLGATADQVAPPVLVMFEAYHATVGGGVQYS